MSESIRVLYRTSIAVVSWVDNNTTFARLYVQDTNGGICESLYDGKSWTAGKVIATAKANSPIAACVDPFHQFLCVFYITTDNIINGMRFGLPASVNQWTPEAINGSNFQASPTSRLAVASNIVAEVGFDVIDYTLYYQKPDGSIGRLACWADKYTEKTSFGAQALAGTGLAAINFRATDEQGTYTATRIFYQLSDGSLTDVVVDRDTNSFNPGEQDLIAKTKGKVPPNTNLSAISTGSDAHPKHQLYSAYSSDETVAAEWGYYSGTWKHANPAQIPLATGGGIAVFNDPNSVPTPLLKVYAQHYTSQILEYTAEDPWVPWKISAIVPTGIRGD